MATVQTYIDRALRLAGQLSAGASPTATESADALVAFNDMVEAWRLEGLMVYAMQEESLTLTSGSSSRTVGPSGNLSTTRPVEIRKAWIVDNSVSYPVRIISHEEYAAIPDKTTTGDWPTVAMIEYTMATATVTYWPVPNASRTMKLLTPVAVTEFAAVGTTVTLPPGYGRALAYNLAVELASEYETEVRPAVAQIAIQSKAAIKRRNMRPIEGYSELAGLLGGGGSRGNILAGA